MRVKSSVQFLENQGLGQFIDVTDQRLKNYDSNSSSAYAPVLRDFNSDGLMDIFLSDGDIGRNNSVGLLMATSDGGWIDTARILFNELVPGISVATMARGPNGHYHLVWDQGANSLGNVMSAEVRWASTEDTTNLVVDQANRVYVDFSDGVTRARDLRRAPAIQAQEDDLLDLTGLAQDLDLDLWWSGNRAPGRKVDATGAVWERGNVIYVSTDRDQKAEWWARVVGVRDLDQDDFWLG
jgi:hypothetical protein